MTSSTLLISCGQTGQVVNSGHSGRETRVQAERFLKRQVESVRQIGDVWMEDEKDCWESLGDVLARLLREIDPRREAA